MAYFLLRTPKRGITSLLSRQLVHLFSPPSPLSAARTVNEDLMSVAPSYVKGIRLKRRSTGMIGKDSDVAFG